MPTAKRTGTQFAKHLLQSLNAGENATQEAYSNLSFAMADTTQTLSRVHLAQEVQQTHRIEKSGKELSMADLYARGEALGKEFDKIEFRKNQETPISDTLFSRMREFGNDARDLSEILDREAHFASVDPAKRWASKTVEDVRHLKQSAVRVEVQANALLATNEAIESVVSAQR